MLLRLLCSGLLGPPHGPLPATSWLRRPRPAPGPVLCVPPPSCWDDCFSFVDHQFPVDRLAGSSDLALVVDDGSTQLTRISLSRAICPGLDQEVACIPSLGVLSLTAWVCCFNSNVLRFCGTGGFVVVGAVHVG